MLACIKNKLLKLFFLEYSDFEYGAYATSQTRTEDNMKYRMLTDVRILI